MRGPIRYQKELQNTYFIVEQCEKELLENYQGQMILRGAVRGLVSCRVHLMDGRRELWYDITSLQTLEQLYAVKELHCAEIRRILEQLIQLMREMEQHLLDGRGLCMAPEYLYQNMEEERLYLLFDFTQRHESGELHRLAEFMIERLCNQEEAAVRLAYAFYEQSMGGDCSLEALEELLEQESEKDISKEHKSPERERFYESASLLGKEKEEEAAPDARKRAWKEEGAPDARKGAWKEEEAPDARKGAWKEEAAPDARKRAWKEETAPDARKGAWKEETAPDLWQGAWEARDQSERKSQLRLAISWKGKNGATMEMGLAAVGTAILGGVGLPIAKRFLILSSSEELVWILIPSLLFLLGMGAFLYGLYREKAGDHQKKGGKASAMSEVTKTEWESEENELEAVLREQEDESDGKTIYIGKELFNREYSLMELQKGEPTGKKYSISEDAFLIGKDQAHVHMTVKDRFVSRVHARLLREEDLLYLEDLHSTNGTYLNDLLLAPHERTKVKRGDILRFGRKEFLLS